MQEPRHSIFPQTVKRHTNGNGDSARWRNHSRVSNAAREPGSVFILRRYETDNRKAVDENILAVLDFIHVHSSEIEFKRRHPHGYVKRQQKIFAAWGQVPIGTPVIVEKDDGTEIETTTRREAWMLSGHTSVIMVCGIVGCYALERVRKKE